MSKVKTKNENWILSDNDNNTEDVFTDKNGKLILKRSYESGQKLNTYYVYDQFGNLTYVIPPKASDLTITVNVLNDLCFQYKYDSRNRITEKKMPGKQWEFIVYDKLDRPVAVGPTFSPFSDINPPNNIGWLITKYDVFNRVIYTGWMQSSNVTSAGRYIIQQARNSVSQLNENKQISGTIDGLQVYYSNLIVPTTGFKLLTVSYYDNYVFPNVAPVPMTVETQPVLQTNQVKGLATGIFTRALFTSSSTAGETKTTFYDIVKARPVRTYSKNFLGGYTQIDYQINFEGLLQKKIVFHKRVSTDTNELKTIENFSYTPEGRVLKVTHELSALPAMPLQPAQLIAENTYNELGQLISKKIGDDVTSPQPLQVVDYSYNIRGWLTEINKVGEDPAIDPNPLIQSGNPNDLFAFKINYQNNDIAALYPGENLVPRQYDGNISETFWRTSTDNIKRKYGYIYDKLGRLLSAVYEKPYTSSPVTNMYNESITYDKNGNIKTLQRNGDYDAASGSIQIDNLTYSYGSSDTTNTLSKIDDPTTSDSVLGFKNGNNTGDDYAYDLNGNMITDLNKGINLTGANPIKYNHLNLPTEIVFSTSPLKKISYSYNADGIKLQKIVTLGSTTTTTDYLGDFQYSNAVLQFFPTKEGYVNFDSGVYKYVFNYLDHLGNVRLSYTKDIAQPNGIAIMQQNHYYPFGLKHTNYNVSVFKLRGSNAVPALGLPNKYQFGGKEYQDEVNLNLYDYGARNYDPANGRWTSVDAAADTFRNFSPYNYSLNNPVFFGDRDGNIPTPYEAALMARFLYQPNGASFEEYNGWKLSTDVKFNVNEKGLKATLFERLKDDGNYEFAYIYKGSDELVDWLSNVLNVIGAAPQYNKALEAAKKVSDAAGLSELTYGGHSLGGALANLSSMATGRSSITFNPAWISIATRVVNFGKFVELMPGSSQTNYVFDRDPLNLIQTFQGLRFGLLPTGQTVFIESQFDDFDPLENHSVDRLIERMPSDENDPETKASPPKKSDDKKGYFDKSHPEMNGTSKSYEYSFPD